MEKVEIRATLFFTIKTAKDWDIIVPTSEQKFRIDELIFIDKNGDVIVDETDMEAITKHDLYPVSIYRMHRSSKFTHN